MSANTDESTQGAEKSAAGDAVTAANETVAQAANQAENPSSATSNENPAAGSSVDEKKAPKKKAAAKKAVAAPSPAPESFRHMNNAADQANKGRKVKTKWEKHEGAVGLLRVKLGSTVLGGKNGLMDRTFYGTMDRIHYIIVHGRVLLDNAQVTEIESHIKAAMDKARDELVQNLAIADELISNMSEHGSLMDVHWNVMCKDEEVKIPNPLVKQHLDLFLLADKYLLRLERLYINNLRTIKERNDEVYKVKKLFNSIHGSVQTLYGRLRTPIGAAEKAVADAGARPAKQSAKAEGDVAPAAEALAA